MSACSKYVPRFKKALEYRGLSFPKDIIDVMGKRANSDRDLDGIIHSIVSILEPPYCQKTHCPHHTAFAFCGCSLSLVPGKCKLNLDYLKNKKLREEKLLNSRINQLNEADRNNLSEYDKGRISAMSKYSWEDFISKRNQKQLVNS